MEVRATGRGRGGIPAWAGWVFRGMGMLSLWVGIDFEFRSDSLGFGTARAEGTVVGLVRQWGSRPGYRLPLVAYQVDGTTYRCKGVIGADPKRLRIGQRVGVLYRRDRPSEGHVDTFFDRWLIPLAFGGVGLVLIGFGYAAVEPGVPGAKAKPRAMTDLE